MKILALDTTSEFGGVAVRSSSQAIANITIHSPEGFGHVLYPTIERALDQAGIRLAEIDIFAAASGPGSFTGVRIGLAAVKGLAESMGKPAVGISNLQALSSFGNLPLRAVVLDARRNEVYAAVYDEELRLIQPETVAPLAEWLEGLHDSQYQFISPGPLALEGTRFVHMPFVAAPACLASAIAACAERQAGSDPAALDANYVRRADAELCWRDG